MDFKKDIDFFWSSTYSLDKSDYLKNNYFIKGFLSGKNDEDFINIISSYLFTMYSIDNKYFTFIEMIEYYSSVNNVNIIDGFYRILNEIHEANFDSLDKIEEVKNEQTDSIIQENTLLGEEISHCIIKKGDVISISDRMGDSYKNTKFFDSSLKTPTWEMFYPQKGKDFKHIYFFIEKNKEVVFFGPLWRLFGNVTVRVEKVVIEEEEIIVYTNFFRIELEKALAEKEIEIEDDKKTNESNLTELLELVKLFNNGISEYNNLNELISNWCFNNVNKLFQKGHNYDRNLNGFWYKISKDAVYNLNKQNPIESHKINLIYSSRKEHLFTLKIENPPQNVFAIDSIESEENKMFLKGDWIFILFAGYSGPDLKLLHELMEIVKDYPNLNFAFKPYMDDDKMQTFTSVNIHRKVPPVILHKNENKTTLVCNRLKSKEKIKELLDKI
ncbi:hypothetical protein [Tenacibaculum ovolyticum]|uniref:hypothetical protein n=1 Tax=Tenacibaculum ovolyticum TaxID=104270 RepID=UPI001F1E5C6A|nr:hypothetical protein [Tenacibaculum ovolyticum]